MTDPEEHPADSTQPRQRWLEDIQEALERTGQAVRTAWDASRESRATALESAKQAAQDLGVALDKGITAARERWNAAEQPPPPSDTLEMPSDESTPAPDADPPA